MVDEILGRSSQSSAQLLDCCDNFSEKALDFAKSIDQIAELLHSVEASFLPRAEDCNQKVGGTEEDQHETGDSKEQIVGLTKLDEQTQREGSKSRRQHRPGSELLWPEKVEQELRCCQKHTEKANNSPNFQPPSQDQSDSTLDDSGRNEDIPMTIGPHDLAWYVSERHVLDEALRAKGSSFVLEKRDPTAEVGGLANQGATCYLNSLLQMLYAVPEFRCFVHHGWEYSPAVHGPPAVCIPLQLQLLFARMQEMPRPAF